MGNALPVLALVATLLRGGGEGGGIWVGAGLACYKASPGLTKTHSLLTFGPPSYLDSHVNFVGHSYENQVGFLKIYFPCLDT